MLAKNKVLESEMKKINSSLVEDRSVQINTVKGLERLGDSLASLKVDMMKEEEEEALDSLRERVTNLGIKLLTHDQEITRSTGRLNKLEQDLGRVNTNLEQRLESKTISGGDIKLRDDVDQLGETLTSTRNTLAEVLNLGSAIIF